MNSFAVAFLFITQLSLLLGMIWLWWRVKDRIRELEARAADSLDGQDLMEFQERIARLLEQVKEAGSEVAAVIDERRAGLDREAGRAREAEKRLAEKIKSLERVEEKARKRLDEWVSRQSRRGKSGRKPLPDLAPAEIPAPADPAPPEAPERPLKVTYLSREFRPPEPRPPVAPSATRYLQVYEMADKGLNREDIAKACGYLPGEIELILNLRPRPRG